MTCGAAARSPDLATAGLVVSNIHHPTAAPRLVHALTFTDPFGLKDCKADDKVCQSMGYAVLTFFGVSDQSARKLMTPAVIGAMVFGPGTGLGVRSIAQGVGLRAAAKADNAGPIAGTTYTQKVMRQVASGDDHGFPKLVDQFAADGSATRTTGGDGVARVKIALPGAKNGEDGNYTWLIEPDGSINHRLFERN